MPTYKNRDGADVTAAQLSDEDLLAMPATDRDKALAELAAKGHRLVAVIVDVSAHCPNELCMDGRVRISEDVVIDCPDCDGAGTIDARPVCTDPGCIDKGHRYQATGYECARVHAHGKRPLPLDVEPPGYPQQDADPFPWDVPIPAEAFRRWEKAADERSLTLETASPWIDRLAKVIGEPLPLPDGTDAEKLRALKERLLATEPPTRGTVADVARAVNKIGLDAAKIFRALEPVAPVIEGELKATALVSDINAKLAALGVNARAELISGAVVVTMGGDATVADVEAIAELLGQAVSSWPGERPRVTGRVETDEARFVTPADLADVVAVPESVADTSAVELRDPPNPSDAEPDDETTGKVLDLFEALCEAKRR